jgi:hypothetical protein
MKSNRCVLPVFLGLLFAVNAAVGQQQLPLFPKYQVLGVIYAPPGASSSVSYSNSTQIGSSHSIVSDSSTTTTQTQSSTSGFSLFGFGYSNTTTTSDSWMSAFQNSSSESLQTTSGNGIAVTGAVSSGLGVVHDNDLIVVWLNPVLKTTLLPPVTSGGVTTFPIQWSGFMFNSCDLAATQNPVNFVQLIDGCDPTAFPGPDIVLLPVFCLKNPYWPPQSCSQYLSHTSRFWDLDPWGVDSVTKVPLGPGLTIQDYADILQADPFVTQTLVASNTQPGENVYTNPCHPTYGINFDPNTQETIPDSTKFTSPFTGKWPAKYCGSPGTMERFNSFSTAIPYPAPPPTGGTTTSTGSLSNNAINMQGMLATDTHSHSFNESTSLTFAAMVSYSFPGGWSVSNLSAGFNFGTTSGSGTTWTDGQTIGHTATQSQTNSASYSVTGPKQSDNWNGPITYNVYQDTVYGTFAFRDPNRSTTTQLIIAGKTSPIGVAFSGSTNFGTVQVGKQSAAITVTLTNNSPNQMTMLSPALSFSDLAVDPTGAKLVSSFQIVAGSDGCSNRVLAAAATCTLKIQFAPTLNAAPNTIQASYPVAAYVIAAGNELVPVADAGATAYNEQVLVTNTVITVSGTTETAVTVSGTATPATPTCTGILPSCNIGATLTPATNSFTAFAGASGSAVMTFKNYYNVPLTVDASPSGVLLSSTTDYSVPSATDNCSGRTVAALGTCSITVQYAVPGVVDATAPPHLNTKVTVVGAVQAGTQMLTASASAGISTNVIGIGLSPTSGSTVLSRLTVNGRTFITLQPFIATVTNNSPDTLTLTSFGTTIGFHATPNTCALNTAMTPGQSCTVDVQVFSGCTDCTISGTFTVNGALGITGNPAIATSESVTGFVTSH